jgi:hypothetical protein
MGSVWLTLAYVAILSTALAPGIWGGVSMFAKNFTYVSDQQRGEVALLAAFGIPFAAIWATIWLYCLPTTWTLLPWGSWETNWWKIFPYIFGLSWWGLGPLFATIQGIGGKFKQFAEDEKRAHEFEEDFKNKLAASSDETMKFEFPDSGHTLYERKSDLPLSKDMLRGENILVSEHSLPEYNGIYTIQNNEINGKPWFKNNSGCILYFYNANSGGGPSWSLDDRSQDGTNDWFRGGWIEPPNSGGPPLGTRRWEGAGTIKMESVSIPDESGEPIFNSDGRKYVFAHEHNGWQWHNERARAMGGHLASITNGIENEQITKISGGAPVWIGGIRKGSGNGPGADHWYWDDGRPWSYTNWHPGEPNNHGGGENRIHLGLQAPGTWNDVPDQWHGPAVYLVPNIVSETSKSSSPEIDILAKFKSKLDISDTSDDFFTTDDYFDDLSSKFKKK